ncbi:hypothetical protein CcCBS67573_g09149 [Chytriomyces confervae]|uniref:Uncharacterized protein n=1 Tax=Chytriomyces confervae TaxID=246404 RepID=A0A507E492_9FUNG|nr:hypothetical protein HDU80_008885 [Chytriomyces hyalinus]TPX58642.1 hypothetical protein CcCBS67573_g09149 [Chytriomyces confervae]
MKQFSRFPSGRSNNVAVANDRKRLLGKLHSIQLNRMSCTRMLTTPSFCDIAFLCTLIIVVIPVVLTLTCMLQTVFPNGRQSDVALLPGQQQLIKLSSNILKSAVFNGVSPATVRTFVFDEEPTFHKDLKKTEIKSDYSLVSLQLSANTLVSTYAVHIIRGGNLQLNTTLPTTATHVSLQLLVMPDVTHEFRSPILFSNLRETHGESFSLMFNASVTGHYILNFLQTVDASQLGKEQEDCEEDSGFISIASNTPVYDTANAIESCGFGSCQLLAKRSAKPGTSTFYALFEQVPLCHEKQANFVNLESAIASIQDTPMSWTYIADARANALERIGVTVGEYEAHTKCVIYIPVAVLLSLVVPAVLMAVLGPLFGFGLRDVLCERRERVEYVVVGKERV